MFNFVFINEMCSVVGKAKEINNSFKKIFSSKPKLVDRWKFSFENFPIKFLLLFYVFCECKTRFKENIIIIVGSFYYTKNNIYTSSNIFNFPINNSKEKQNYLFCCLVFVSKISCNFICFLHRSSDRTILLTVADLQSLLQYPWPTEYVIFLMKVNIYLWLS